MSAGIKRVCESRKAFHRSKSESQAETSLQTRRFNETRSLSPCSEQSSVFDNTKCDCCGTMENLTASMLNNMRSEMYKLITPVVDEVKHTLVSPLMDEMKQLRQDMKNFQTIMQSPKNIQTFTPSSYVEALETCVRAECRTKDISCSSNEPQGLLNESGDKKEGIYQDMNEAARRSDEVRGIDNKLYDYVHGNTHNPLNNNKDSNGAVGEEKGVSRIQHNTQSPKTTRPKEIRSKSVQDRAKIVSVAPRRRSHIHINKVFDERECLANALQFHVEDLVDGLIFRDSELPDSLLADDCLTEDECATLRKFPDRKDQIRILLTLVKGRDLRILEAFMIHVRKQSPEVAQKINAKFEQNKTDGVKGKLCALCKLEKQFNVKHVADSLWAIQAIDDGLYNTIIVSEAPLGAQDAQWKKVIQCMNILEKQKAELAQRKLINALSNKNLFVHLADGISDMLIKNHGKLTCLCEPRLILPKRNTSFSGGITSAESFLPDSSSECYSNDSSSLDGSEGIDMQDKGNTCGNTDGMSIIKEENETMLSPSPSSIVQKQTNCFSTPPQQQINTAPITASDNNLSASSSMQKPNALESLKSTQPDSSKTLKKPIVPKKPPIPLKQPCMNLDKDSNELREVKTCVLQQNPTEINTPLDLSLKSSPQNAQVVDSGLPDSKNSIPPLPKKVNQTRKTLL